MKSIFVQKFKNLVWKTGILESHDLLLRIYLDSTAQTSRNPLHKATLFRGFSQGDEDFLISKILGRIGETKKTFVEFGVGDGLENNSLALLLQGWRGLWIGNEELKIDIPVTEGSSKPPLGYIKEWIDLNSLKVIIPQIQVLNPSVVSMDLDGNDYHFTKTLLENGIRPKLFLQEYNAIFGSEISWIMPYEPNHLWSGDTRWGASLKAYVQLFDKFNYRLVACSLTGVNAFFVQRDFDPHFKDIPDSTAELYHQYTPWFEKSKQAIDPRILVRKFES